MSREERIQLFQQSMAAVQWLAGQFPGDPALISIHNQLQFLLDQAAGAPRQQQALDQINIGLLAVRQVESMNQQVADLLHSAAGEARKMRNEN